jgi:hypothetical protein
VGGRGWNACKSGSFVALLLLRGSCCRRGHWWAQDKDEDECKEKKNKKKESHRKLRGKKERKERKGKCGGKMSFWNLSLCLATILFLFFSFPLLSFALLPPSPTASSIHSLSRSMAPSPLTSLLYIYSHDLHHASADVLHHKSCEMLIRGIMLGAQDVKNVMWGEIDQREREREREISSMMQGRWVLNGYFFFQLAHFS